MFKLDIVLNVGHDERRGRGALPDWEGWSRIVS